MTGRRYAVSIPSWGPDFDRVIDGKTVKDVRKMMIKSLVESRGITFGEALKLIRVRRHHEEGAKRG
jgi:hypothetical protein